MKRLISVTITAHADRRLSIMTDEIEKKQKGDGNTKGCFVTNKLALLFLLTFAAVVVIVAVIVFVTSEIKTCECKWPESCSQTGSEKKTDMCLFDTLVSAEWLSRKLHQTKLGNKGCIRVIDGGIHEDKTGGYEHYIDGHIPGALFYNVSKCVVGASPSVGDMPERSCFEDYVRRLGISKNTHVIVYDSFLNLISSRIWWTFRLFGHAKISILDGGISKWTADGYSNTTLVKRVQESDFKITYKPKLLVTYEDMVDIVNGRTSQIVDSRARDEFTGAEVIPGFKAGHIPGSKNVPLTSVLNNDSTFKPSAVLKKVFQEAGIDLKRPLVSTCRMGIAATLIASIAHVLGIPDVPSYDGSWQEWSLKASDDMIVTGE